METWLEDAASWTKFTAKIKKKTVNGVHERIEHKPAGIGNNHDTLAKYRNGMLVKYEDFAKIIKFKSKTSKISRLFREICLMLAFLGF